MLDPETGLEIEISSPWQPAPIDLDELDTEDLEVELDGARESALEELRLLLDDFMTGEESREETVKELRTDLEEWEAEVHDNPFAEFPQLAQGWNDCLDSIIEGYSLILMGIDQDQPEFLQAGYLMVEEGIYGRGELLACETD
ncbi:MAG: hypothetical protein AB7S38_13095 [Vulcanimicrobiota bacterium]